MHIEGKYSWLKHLDFMIIDLISMIISFIAAYAIKFGRFDFLRDQSWRTLLVLIVVIYMLIAMFVNPYSGVFRRSYYEDILKTFLFAAYNFIFTALLIYLMKIGNPLSRTVFILTYILYFLLSVILKYIWKKLIVGKKIKISTTSVISLFVFTESKGAGRIVDNAQAGDFKLYDIKGICFVDVTSDSRVKKNVRKIPVVSSLDEAMEFILQNNIEEVLIAIDPGRIQSDMYNRLIDNGIIIHMNVESMTGIQTEDQLLTTIGVYRTLTLGQFRFTPSQMVYLVIKRVCDLIIGIIGIIIMIPVTIAIKLAYLISGDKAPIFYTQKRIGYRGKEFILFKYRTMCPNAEDVLRKMLKDEEYREEWERDQKFDVDPRITKIGKSLRASSIDELPQMINLLNGTMSLVGPRPLVEGELSDHDGLRLYQKVKPGITGWWACNGRSDIGYRERLELEYYYVKNCSVYLDILCLIRTIAALFKMKGAK